MHHEKFFVSEAIYVAFFLVTHWTQDENWIYVKAFRGQPGRLLNALCAFIYALCLGVMNFVLFLVFFVSFLGRLNKFWKEKKGTIKSNFIHVLFAKSFQKTVILTNFLLKSK